MIRHVSDLTTEELEQAAAEAWCAAAQEALAKGLSITGSRDGRRYRHHPDGRIEDLGPVAPLPAGQTDRTKPTTQVEEKAEEDVALLEKGAPFEQSA
jgi:hypothetical protein